MVSLAKASVGTEFKTVSVATLRVALNFKTVSLANNQCRAQKIRPGDGCDNFYPDESPMPRGGRRRRGAGRQCARGMAGTRGRPSSLKPSQRPRLTQQKPARDRPAESQAPER